MNRESRLVMENLGECRAREVRRCPDCGRSMIGTRGTYQYTECGLSSVTLLKVLVFHCDCGSFAPEIPAIGELHGLIALSLLRKHSLLAGEEVKFLRKSAGLSQTELAKLMGVDPTRPSKWEKSGVTRETDRFLRSLCLAGLQQKLCASPSKQAITVMVAKQASQLNLGELLRNVQEKKSGPRKVEFQLDTNRGSEGPWFVPSQETRHALSI